MPTGPLPTPHRRQETPWTCVPACARMVLEHHGQSCTEEQVANLLGTTPVGTRSAHLRRLEAWGFSVDRTQLSVAQLEACLADGLPVIACIHTGPLPHWDADDPHSVVVVGITSGSVLMHDPASDAGPVTCTLDEFRQAWSCTANLAAVIAPGHSPDRSE